MENIIMNSVVDSLLDEIGLPEDARPGENAISYKRRIQNELNKKIMSEVNQFNNFKPLQK
jgi:hypothetical protein